jgi:sulfide dehydrogenase cytochrome subunit
MSSKFVRIRGLASFFALAGLLLAGAASAEDPTVNRLLASQCAQCHGTNGYALGEIDELAGEDAKDLYEDLSDMKGEDRPEDIMDHQALGYTDEQIRRIASYYAGLPEDERKPGGSRSDRSDDEDDEDDEDEKDED